MTPHSRLSTASAEIATMRNAIHQALGTVLSEDFDANDKALVAMYGGAEACQLFVDDLTGVLSSISNLQTRMADAYEAGQRRAFGLV